MDNKTKEMNATSKVKIPMSKRLNLIALIMVGVFVLILLSKITKNWKHKYDSDYLAKTKIMMQKSAQSATIAHQDSNAIMGLMHASEAMAYLQAARLMLPASKIEMLGALDPVELEEQIRNQQQLAIKSIIQYCPDVKPKGKSVNGWISK